MEIVSNYRNNIINDICVYIYIYIIIIIIM